MCAHGWCESMPVHVIVLMTYTWFCSINRSFTGKYKSKVKQSRLVLTGFIPIFDMSHSDTQGKDT